MAANCSHLESIAATGPASQICLECKTEGTQPVQLRECLGCGHIGCCDSSIGQHARKHFMQSQHPIIQSFQTGAESEWRYCYIDKTYLD